MLIHDRAYEKPFFLNVIENEQKVKRDKKSDENFKPFPNRREIVQEIPLSELKTDAYYCLETLQSLTKWKVKIFTKDDQYFLYEIQGDLVRYTNITEFIYAQLELLQIFGCRAILFVVVVYLISLIFVKTSLTNLKKLTDFAENLDFKDLSSRISIDGPKNDEIKLIADALNGSLEKIHNQVVSLKDFIWNASHELKTPLMMINTEIDLALKVKDYEKRLSVIKENTKRLSNLLEDLALITRLESSVHFEKEEVCLDDIFSDIKEMLMVKYPHKTINFQWEKEVKIRANKNLLSIVIKNLLENACKYSGESADIIFIQTSSSFSVKDTGKWISEEDQKHLFERFWQKEKVEGENHSFWLWLYLVKKIIELHQWQVTLVSEIWKGSEFVVQFDDLTE